MSEEWIDCPDARRTGATTLKIKVVPYRGMLAGRILATDSKNVTLPYVLSLNRVTRLKEKILDTMNENQHSVPKR